jgi:hypothetical protein
MDIFRLDPVTYLPTILIENYNSMIWTERFIGSGEFELRTSNVFDTLSLIPQDSLIGIRDSNEVMIAETRSIENDSDGYPELKIVGRTLETFLENRALVATVYNTQWAPLQAYTTAEIADLLVWNHLANATGQDPTRAARTMDPLNAIPNLVITDSSNVVEAPAQWWFQQGQVYEIFKNILELGIVGVRNIRPDTTLGPISSTGTIVTFDVSDTAARGTAIKTVTPLINSMRIDIYNGTDRSHLQLDRPPVIFYYDAGHIDEPKYLFSNQNYKNIATVVSSSGANSVVGAGVDPNVAGLKRKVLFVDVNSNDTGVLRATGDAQRAQKGRIELQKYKRTRMFDGSINETTPYKYRIDYKLGDIVSLIARMGFQEQMLVSEYIRTDDKDGDRGYPGLTSLLI